MQENSNSDSDRDSPRPSQDVWNEPQPSAQNQFSLVSESHQEEKQELEQFGTVRSLAGNALHQFTDLVNDNLIAARYGTFATIALLSVYGIAHSPLMFRFKTVADVPTSYFLKRKKLKCRLIRIIPPPTTIDTSRLPLKNRNDPNQPVICLVRHLSPVGSLLTRSAFRFWIKASPAAALGISLQDNARELMHVQIAGISHPPFYQSHTEGPGEWLDRLAEAQTFVTCQLLARRTPLQNNSNTPPIAVARLSFRPKLLSLFPKDLAESLVRYGRVTRSKEGIQTTLTSSGDNDALVETTCSLDREHLKQDETYSARLEKAEYEAVKDSYGQWSDSGIRQQHKDLVEQVEFQATATMFQKLWKRLVRRVQT